MIKLNGKDAVAITLDDMAGAASPGFAMPVAGDISMTLQHGVGALLGSRSRGAAVIDVTLNIATVSELNVRENRWTRIARAKSQRQQTRLMLLTEIFRRKLTLAMPLRVTLTRIGVRELDGDNLQGALKHVRDGVADAVRVDDGDKRYDWQYRQAKGKRKAVRIVIERGRHETDEA